jgi:hypothetical protein
MDASHRPSRLLFVACARGRTRRARESAVSFFSEREAGARRARDAKANEFAKAKKNMPTVVDPRFIFVAGGDLLVNPSMSPPFHTPVPDEDEKGVQR